LPYKVFTIASGLIGFNILIFIVISLISRGLRFFIVSYLSYKFGNLFTKFMEKHGSKWFTIIGILIVIIGVIIYLILKFYD
jgi:membrane protein DedA with SNARE-associated domain